MKSHTLLILPLVPLLFCTALLIPPLPLTAGQLTPSFKYPQVTANQTLGSSGLLPTLICEKGPIWNRLKLDDEDCQTLIKHLKLSTNEQHFPQPHQAKYLHYGTCVVIIKSGPGQAPFRETLATIGSIADDIFHKCSWTRYGGTRVDFKSGWEVKLCHPWTRPSVTAE